MSIGKKIGGCVYVHRDYIDDVFCDMGWALEQVPADWHWTVVKVSLTEPRCSFIKCDDFDTADEPTVGDSLIVKPDAPIKIVRAPGDPWIYHHKWMMVGPDYKGFDVEESKARSRQWEKLTIDRRRIGKKSYWEEHVMKLLNP